MPLPPASALASAELKTFSNTRGTPRMKFGLNEASESVSLVRSALWARTTPLLIDSTWMKRANTCARGMNSRHRFPGLTTSGSWWAAACEVCTKFAWVSTQPFDLPVVPEV